MDGLGLPGNWMIRGSGTTISTDIPWLFEDPTAGDVMADSNQVISLTFDTNVPEVTEPGTYTGTLQVLTDDAVNAIFDVPITMTVDAGTYGKLEGVVTTTGYCDINPAPLVGVDVFIESSTGETWTVQTNTAGQYSIWLDSNDNPYTVTVDAGPQYEVGMAVVNLSGNAVVGQDFGLRYLAPCPAVEPLAIHETVDWGMSTTVPISIYNTGAVTYSWMFAEQNLGDDVSGAPGVIPYLSEDFESWPPAGWYITESITSSTTSCMWESTATTGRANYTGGTGNAADADSDWCGEAMDTEMWTPPIDLSGASAPSLSFWTQFWVWGDDHAYVDISTDGGANWTNLLHYTSDVNGPHQETIDLSAYAGEPSVIIRFRYTAAGWDWFWEVDDVLVAEVDPVTWMSEDPTSGEALPDTGESNAAVTLDAGVPEITQPGDYVAILQVTDGTYEMNVPVTLTVNPDPTWGELSGVVYSLGACDVNTATLEGADVTIANISGTIAALTTGADGAYSYWLPPDTYTVTVAEGDHVADSAVVTITASGATQDFYLHWVGPCFSDLNPKAIEVTINMGMTDTVPVTLTNSGLGDMNWSVGLLPLLSEDFEGAFPPAGWTVYDNAGTGMMWHRNDYFGVGNQAAFGSGYSAAAHAYLSGAAWDTELWSPPVFLPGDTILTYASNFQDYAGNGDMWLDISTDGGATWTNLRYQTTDDPFGGTFETEDLSAYTGQTVILRWRYSATSSTAWFWHIDDVKLTMVVPWLSVAPDAGTAAPGSDSTTNVGFDAGQVDAPGDYYATLLVETDDPSHPQATIPVTMHVTLPSDWAYVTGDVFGVNGCGQDPMPLEGAQVVLVPLGSAALPVTFTTTTDASGSYSYWLDEVWGPLNIFVTYPGYEDGEMYGVVITGSATTTANFTLRALEPCAGVEPFGISAVVELGMTDTVPFSITNTGAFTLTWELEEESGYEFVPAWA
ncbi:MAG TPA: hypothetical protein ENK17_03320, partial [Anaerolineae bacterium]|nr:hypothetical protein [Anaerolineae bacterium]